MGTNNPVVGVISLIFTLCVTAFLGFQEEFLTMGVAALVSVAVAVDLVHKHKRKA